MPDDDVFAKITPHEFMDLWRALQSESIRQGRNTAITIHDMCLLAAFEKFGLPDKVKLIEVLRYADGLEMGFTMKILRETEH